MKTTNKKLASVSVAGITALGIISIPAIASAGVYGIPDSQTQRRGFEASATYHSNYHRTIHYSYYSSDWGRWKNTRCHHTLEQYKEYKYKYPSFFSWLPRSLMRYFNWGHWEWVTRDGSAVC